MASLFATWIVPLIISASIATLLTAIFAFRFRTWNRKGLLAVYFLVFFGLELTLQELFIPPGALGLEVAAVCFFIAGLFIAATRFAMHAEEAEKAKHDRP